MRPRAFVAAVTVCASLIAGAAGVGGVAAASTAPARRVALRIVGESPTDHSHGVGGATPIVLRFNRPLSPNSALPAVSPAVAGSWLRGRAELTFTPAGAYGPDGVVSVVVPGGPTGVRALDGATLATSSSSSFTTGAGSVLRAEQILSRLGYLPLQFESPHPWASSEATYQQAVYSPPAGRFAWRFDPPPALRRLWSPGAASAMLSGAVMRFEERSGLAVDGQLDAPVWQRLLAEGRDLAANYDRAGYVWALASQNLPETLDVYDNGRVVLQSLANTGISLSPTTDGTYPVYLRFASQIMRGVDPWGDSYADPVSWVAYFDGSQAVHYIARTSYGYAQSLGCVELPYGAAETAWSYLQIGALVSVVG